MKNWLGILIESPRNASSESLVGALMSLKFSSTLSSWLQSTTNSPLVMFFGIITNYYYKQAFQKLRLLFCCFFTFEAAFDTNLDFQKLPFFVQSVFFNIINVMFEAKFPRVTFFFGPDLSIADFQVIAKLGKGAYGQVNLHKHFQTGKQYAIKKIQLFKQGKKSVTQQSIEMLTRKQLQILYKIDNDHIIKLIDHFQDRESVYLITEFIIGANLYDQTLKVSRHLPNEIIADIIYQVCQGLQQLHQNHVIHRDIKLQNLMYANQTVKIVDLGCSNFYGQNISRQTTIGTRFYWSPEIIGQQEQNDRLDVWCVGVVLYELLFLEQPFTIQDIQRKIRKCQYSFPGQHVPQAELEDLFRKVFTHKNMRLTAKQLKNHSWIKKYRQRQEYVHKRFEQYFSADQVQSYSEFLKTNSVNTSIYLQQIKNRTQKLENLLKEARRQLKKK